MPSARSVPTACREPAATALAYRQTHQVPVGKTTSYSPSLNRRHASRYASVKSWIARIAATRTSRDFAAMAGRIWNHFSRDFGGLRAPQVIPITGPELVIASVQAVQRAGERGVRGGS